MGTDELFDVSAQIVVITGASGQLGTEYVSTFLERGARVVGIDIRPSAAVQDVARGYPDRFLFCTADVTVKSELQQSLAVAAERFGVPSVLVNNAAIDSPPSAPPEENGPFEEYPEGSWDRVMDVNLKGPHLCCQVFGAAMAAEGRGSIINIVSIYGLVSPDQRLYEYRRKRGENFYKPVAYSVSKSGLLNLSRYLAVYWATKGVRVNSLTLAGVFNGQDSEFVRAYCDRVPVGRMATPQEYNGAVLFLASSASKYMTGANLVVDGGWTAI